MGGCSSQSVTRWLVIALAAVLVACSGGSGGGEKASPKTSPPSSSNPPPTIDLSKPIPGGSLHGTPRPPLENTGADYVAIVTSLTRNFRWGSENPDAALISDIYVPGTRIHDLQRDVFRRLAENGWRAADDGYRLVEVTPLDVRPETVALRVRDQFDFERIVDASGNQVGEGRAHDGPVTWSVLLSVDASGKWRIADWSPAGGGSVEL
jgi:hypothetical protein